MESKCFSQEGVEDQLPTVDCGSTIYPSSGGFEVWSEDHSIPSLFASRCAKLNTLEE
jgi:hypothetical protein